MAPSLQRFSLVATGLDPGTMLTFDSGWIAGSSPAMTKWREVRSRIAKEVDGQIKSGHDDYELAIDPSS
jgi:hypothetical protein